MQLSCTSSLRIAFPRLFKLKISLLQMWTQSERFVLTTHLCWIIISQKAEPSRLVTHMEWLRCFESSGAVINGAFSDHSAVRMKMKRMSIERKVSNKISRGMLNKELLTKDNRDEYNRLVSEKLEEHS